MNDTGQEALTTFINTWEETPAGTRRLFLRLKNYLETRQPALLTFNARPGVSYSLRAAAPGRRRELFALVDVIGDDPQSRWLSVCFYEDAITDPEEQGNRIPGGILGEDGYCFDLTADDNALEKYVLARIDEAHQSVIR